MILSKRLQNAIEAFLVTISALGIASTIAIVGCWMSPGGWETQKVIAGCFSGSLVIGLFMGVIFWVADP